MNLGILPTYPPHLWSLLIQGTTVKHAILTVLLLPFLPCLLSRHGASFPWISLNLHKLPLNYLKILSVKLHLTFLSPEKSVNFQIFPPPFSLF